MGKITKNFKVTCKYICNDHISKIILASFFIALALGCGIYNQAYATTGTAMNGYFNIGEKIYANGTTSYEYYLFADNNTSNQTPYYLHIAKPEKSMFNLLGKHVQVLGHMNARNTQHAKFVSNAKEMYVDSITPSQNKASMQSAPEASTSLFTSPIVSVVALLQYNDEPSVVPHTSTYFQSRFYNDADSLSAYFNHNSYGSLTMSGQVVNWHLLPKTKAQYGNPFQDQTAAADAINLIDSSVNFNGIQEVFFVFNDDLSCGCAFAYLGPITVNTNEGQKAILEEFIPDMGDGFPVGADYQKGIGVVAHETGHTLGWTHTSPPPPAIFAYEDPWSVMSGWNDNKGPPGIISFNRDEAGWIPSAKKFTAPNGQQSTFTLDVLDVSSPGTNYLMGKVPFGSAGNYLILEARKNGTFDYTPQSQTSLVIYNYSSTGHPESPEPGDLVNIVDISGSGDWNNDDLHAGDTYTWSRYNIVISVLSQTSNTMTVSVSNNNLSSCIPSTSPWDVTTSCTLSATATASGDVIVESGVTLTIPSSLSLNIDFAHHHLLIKSGGKVLIKSGGKIS